MGFIFDLLTAPVLGPARFVCWLGKGVGQEAERRSPDPEQVRGELLELQMRLDMGEITEEDYARQEQALVEQLRAAWG